MSLALVKDESINATFADFWLLYPRRVARKDAQKAWDRMSASDRIEALTALVAWRRVWATKDLEYLPYPSTWLNGERWTDELPVSATSSPNHASHVLAVPAGGEIQRAGIPDHVKALIAKLRAK